MLPTFPKIAALQRQQNYLFIEATARARAPMIGMIQQVVQHEGDVAAIHRADATVGEVTFKAASAELVIDRVPLVEFGPQAVVKHLENVAAQIAESASRHAYEQINAATLEVGNVVDGGGRPLDEELMLEVLEKMEFAFNEHGEWLRPVLFAHPTTIDRLKHNGEQASAEFDAKLKAMIAKKRDDHRRREADRVLAG